MQKNQATIINPNSVHYKLITIKKKCRQLLCKNIVHLHNAHKSNPENNSSSVRQHHSRISRRPTPDYE